MTKETLAYENIDREFKELYVSDIKKTVVAFANTEGGILYIGINDAGEVVGLPNVDDVMQQTANTLKDSIAPDVMPFVKIRAVTKEGKQIIKVAAQHRRAALHQPSVLRCLRSAFLAAHPLPTEW